MYYQYFADTNPLQAIEYKYFTPKIPPGGEGGPHGSISENAQTDS
jgi:hypothetical protein